MLIILIASIQADAATGIKLVENKNGRELTFSQSIKFCLPATYPPTTPIALERVPICKSTSFCKPKCLTVPAPLPVTPEPWASST